ncbi:oligopeptide/dipeptide ABC transporter, ATP-binding protein, C-terminal domain-containing protein [Nocardioides exalbidus]|uniref:Oligopeptide/dipeptide ABC transporter, ATP-binding protein, C-terminal domain-containing protein n=1 Tax=Nocardioides exalbidus TaxID=402596 RepID=A0A1H4YP99_9ACTN|nr:dipeptide/oligopeptide/nickel ABC transporter permease/ATP-binding protein [Nocardioides exalbidus]SED18998.1 oligopeptide/dipeptide ABC transporter, ATP-binding protein, C-terminal domain-containing protein [Nocardioides exalbidus]
MSEPISRVRAWRDVLTTPLGGTAAVLVVVVLALAVVGPLVWGDAADAVDTGDILSVPSGEHWAGTDNLGRDILARVLVAARLSMLLAMGAITIAIVVGLVLGSAPFLLGGRAGRLVSAVVNVAVAFPGLLLALFFAVIFGVGATGAVLAIGLSGAPGFARLVQTLVAGLAGREYVAAARVAGVGRLRILVRHVLPNLAEPLVVNATIGAGNSLLAFAGLSFLGLGVQSPAYDWGRLLYDGLSALYVNPAAALAPGAAVLVAGLAFNLFGESVAKGFGVTDLAGPRVRTATTRPAPEPQVDHDPTDARPERDVVLEVRELRVGFAGRHGTVRPVRGVSFSVHRGEAVGVVGESGSGKSLTALAVTRLLGDDATVEADRLRLLGEDLLGAASPARRHLLGTSLAMVFQDPMSSFNPTRRIGRQLAEVATEHQGLSRADALARAVDRLAAVRIDDAGDRVRQYPHEFSGGMRQRAMIGMGLMGSPALVVADEPTTALDVTVQQQVLGLLASIREADDVALVLISHDVTVVGEVCDRVLVMYAGRIVEDLPAADLTSRAQHPYTRALVSSVPDMATDITQPLATIPGRPVGPADVPPGCAYADRCPLADARCRTDEPVLEETAAGGRVACWHPGGGPVLVGQDLLARPTGEER